MSAVLTAQAFDIQMSREQSRKEYVPHVHRPNLTDMLQLETWNLQNHEKVPKLVVHELCCVGMLYSPENESR